MSNTDIWDALAKTDPKHTKKFKRAGGFSGTSVKPIYMTRKMTEQFGPAGKGWGMGEPKFDVVNAGDEILVYCTAAVWWTDGSPEASANYVFGVGGDKVVTKRQNGPFFDDEAFKKSYTDALSNAMKQIGMAADIHMGQHDDDKYVQAVAREIAEDERGGNKATKDADWTGPLVKTSLKAEMSDLLKRIAKCDTADDVQSVRDEYTAVIEQCQKDLPGDWAGDGGDIKGYEAEIELTVKRALDADAKQAKEYFGAILTCKTQEEANEVLTRTGYDEWLADFQKRRKADAEAVSAKVNKLLQSKQSVTEAA